MTTTDLAPAPAPVLAPSPGNATNQLELGLAPATPPARPRNPATPRPVRRPAPGPVRRQTRTRRFAVARWWFNQMREAVVAARDWPVAETTEDDSNPRGATPGCATPQTTLDLISPPTRLERRPLPLPLAA